MSKEYRSDSAHDRALQRALRALVGAATVAAAVLAANVAVRATTLKAHGRTTRNPDDAFVAMMIPHHQGAIDMAIAELRDGHNQQLRRLAQEIIVTQQEEIAVLRRARSAQRASAKPADAFTTQTVSVSHRDRVFAAEQISNTVSVTDPADNRLLGVIRLGDPVPGNLSPLYRGQLLVHGLGYSPDHQTLVVVSIGSNSVTFIDTKTNVVKHVTYVGRAPHEAFFTPDGREVWVTVRGEDYVSVIDGVTYAEKLRITVPNGPGMQIFSPDGKYGYLCSSFTPMTVVISVAEHRIVGHIPQPSPFCPNIAVTPDGDQVWFTLKDVGRTVVFDGRPPFSVLKTLETGPITNHVNITRNDRGTFAYVTVGGLNEVQVFRTDDFSKVATIPVGPLPHGVWPSGDGTRVYVGLENDDRLVAIDALANAVIATIPIGQAPQALVYVSSAVPDGGGTQGLEPLGIAGQATHLFLAPAGANHAQRAPTSVSLFDQGLQQVLQASVTGLNPEKPFVLALARRADGSGALEPLAAFMTNPAGAAIVNAIGPIRQVVRDTTAAERRYLVLVAGTPTQHGPPVQVQVP
jgi:YVTN family beta-propeller protein